MTAGADRGELATKGDVDAKLAALEARMYRALWIQAVAFALIVLIVAAGTGVIVLRAIAPSPAVAALQAHPAAERRRLRYRHKPTGGPRDGGNRPRRYARARPHTHWATDTATSPGAASAGLPTRRPRRRLTAAGRRKPCERRAGGSFPGRGGRVFPRAAGAPPVRVTVLLERHAGFRRASKARSSMPACLSRGCKHPRG